MKQTNAQRIQSLTIDELAVQNVRPFTYMNGYHVNTIFQTSDGYMAETREEAEEYERNLQQAK